MCEGELLQARDAVLLHKGLEGRLGLVGLFGVLPTSTGSGTLLRLALGYEGLKGGWGGRGLSTNQCSHIRPQVVFHCGYVGSQRLKVLCKSLGLAGDQVLGHVLGVRPDLFGQGDNKALLFFREGPESGVYLGVGGGTGGGLGRCRGGGLCGCC